MTGGLLSALSVYRDTRMLKILLLGFISGFPWLLIGSMLSLWLSDEGVSKTGIGLFGIVGVVYAINALWAPLIDGARLPFLSDKFGRRRAWIILMQAVIIIAMVALATLPSATESLWWVALFIFIIALASATQDVAIDALRIELINKNEPEKVGPGAAMATSGWWLGFGGGKVVALPLVAMLQSAGLQHAWQIGYFSLTVVVVACVLLLLRFVNEPPAVAMPSIAQMNNVNIITLLWRAGAVYIAPIKNFISQYALSLALLILFFIFFFKIGEAFLGRMSIVFYKEVGFSKSEIGLLSGGLGTITVCVFAILGSIINARYGLYKGIIVGGVAMASTNLLFALLAVYPEKWLFAVAVVADQFTTAVSTVAFVAFLSQLCAREYAATQYAALASLGNLSRTVLAASSGFLIEDVLDNNWPLFFIITTLMVLPSLLILISQKRRLAPIMAGVKAGDN